MRRFWRRSRDWPLRGQLAFALVVVLVVAAVAGGISNALYPDASTRPATAGPVAPPRSTSSSPTNTVAHTSTTRALPASSRLLALTIRPQSHESSYERAVDFGGWTGQTGCRDTRAVLLIRTSRAPVTFTTLSGCTVKTGRWIDPWSGITTTVAHGFQIDHTVPLENAWVSGAWSWTHDRRVAYANDLTDTDHLVAIDASENESKGARGPAEWRPPNASTWCRYALDWDRIKAKWHLSATATEWKALTVMVATC